MLDCVEEMWSQIQIQELHYLGQNLSFEGAYTYLGVLPGMSLNWDSHCCARTLVMVSQEQPVPV